MSNQLRTAPTFLERIGTVIFHTRERTRLGVKRLLKKPSAVVVRSRAADIVGDFIILNNDDYIQRYQRAGEFFESSELELVRKHFRGGVFVDVGANIGNHAIYFAQLPNCTKVIAFEPNPRAIQILKINILLNKLEQKITLYEFALGATSTVERIAFSANNLGRTLIVEAGGQEIPGPERVEVQVSPGDMALKDTNVDFIKIDVEGYEMQVLRGLVSTIKRCKPTLFVEVWQENQADFAAFLMTANYQAIQRLHNGAFDLILAQPL